MWWSTEKSRSVSCSLSMRVLSTHGLSLVPHIYIANGVHYYVILFCALGGCDKGMCLTIVIEACDVWISQTLIM